MIAKKLVEWLATTHMLSYPRGVLMRAITHALSVKHGTILFFDDPERARVFRLIRKIKNETEMLLDTTEAYQLFMAVQRTAKIPGDIAEVGVYKGGSARIICMAKGEKHLHLFDTFDGLPELSVYDNTKQFHKSQYRASFESVRRYLDFQNVHIHKGVFPGTGKNVRNKKFSLVNLDADLHDSTIQSLHFFYPRMSKGGVILSHDYLTAPGVRKAFDDFFRDKPEPIIQLAGTQCLIVKI